MIDASVNKKDPFRWVMLLFIFLFYFTVLGFANQSFNILLRTITEDMGWTDVQRTAIAAAMSSGMIWFVFLAGTLLDRFSAKKILGSAMVLIAALLILRGQAQGFTFFFGLMFAFGVVSAFYMPACTKIISLWFDSGELAVANGFLTAASPLGQVTANLFAVPIMAAIGGWRMLYTVVGVSVAVIVIFFFIGKERKSEDAALTSTVLKSEDLRFWKNIGGIMKLPLVWIYCIANMCFLGTIYAGGALGQLVLQSDPNWLLDPSVSGTIPAFNNMFSMCAYILVPIIIARVGRKYYRHAAIIAGVIAPFLYFYAYRSYSMVAACTCLAIAGILYGAIVPAPKILMLQLPEVSGLRSGTAIGLYTTVERIGITVFTSILGGLISAQPQRMAEVFSTFWLVQLVSPALLILTLVIGNRRKKETTGNQEAVA